MAQPPLKLAVSSPISPLTQALRLLQSQRTKPTGAAARPRSHTGANPSDLASTAAAGSATSALLGLPARLQALRARHGTLLRGQTMRLFVEAALLDDLGAELQLDPAFGDLVERTCQALEQEAANGRLIDAVMQELADLAE